MDAKSIAGVLVNRLVIGFLIVVIWGLATGLSLYVLGVSLSADLSYLESGVSNIWSIQGFGQIIFWVFSTIILAVVGIFVIKHRGTFSPYKGENIRDELPKKTKFVTLLIIGGVLSFLIWVSQSVLSIIDESLASPNPSALISAIQNGDFNSIIAFMIGAIIVGIIAVAWIGSGKGERIAEDTGLDKF